MKKIYTFLPLRLAAILSLFLLFTSSSVHGQCGALVEDFNNTGGSTAGFTGNFFYSSLGADGYLVKNKILSFAQYSVTTPTYQLPADQTIVGFGFTLGGTVQVSSVMVYVQYVSTISQDVITVPVGSAVTPTYTAGTGTVCTNVSFANLPSFPTAGKYRLVFNFAPASGGGTAAETITFDNYMTNGTISLSPLPVTFLSFDAKTINNNVVLTWRVAGEENIVRYEVEKSSDGRRFATIGSVAKTGQNIYSYTDAISAGIVYYRIKNVGNDNTFKYSTVARLVNGRSEIVFKAFPQPVQSQLVLQYPNVSGKALISISTAEGKLVRSVVPSSGSMQSTVDMSGLQKGLYIIRLDTGDGNVKTLKVVKQ